ncbi:hypothetical protein HF325_004365 [Metschnikowia pulcherrima]|uniref:Uncharacterized protein n=1 Tax=Metschnikowia pulcherrima TaxID=27326 RepID=A0A8H7GQC4_9ASCO|nr:hypothetical protein HF325_004365 [Metschnikowia pulcherrima]
MSVLIFEIDDMLHVDVLELKDGGFCGLMILLLAVVATARNDTQSSVQRKETRFILEAKSFESNEV